VNPRWSRPPHTWLLHLSSAMFKEAFAFEPFEVQLQRRACARLPRSRSQ
jgi:hypothetical protein